MFVQKEYEAQGKEKDSEIEKLKNEMKAMYRDNEDLKDEKIRIMGVNAMLE